ncbi:MAG: hypothetical protein ACI4V5_01015 [Prevotella sp.]
MRRSSNINILVYITIVCIFVIGIFVLASCGDKGRDNAEAYTLSLKQKLKQARMFQDSAKYSDAIEVYQAVVMSEPPAQIDVDTISAIVDAAMTQMMNCYQSNGQPDECADYFLELRNRHTHFVHQFLWADMYSILGYALSRTERMKDAELITDSALTMPLDNATPKRLFRMYSYAAAVFFCNPACQERVITLCNKALEVADEDHSIKGVEFITSMLGLLYKRTGNIDKAADLFHDSVDRAHARGDDLAEANACNSLAELYLYCDLPRHALTYSASAMRLAKNAHNVTPAIMSQTYLEYGQAMCALQHTDSAIFYYKKAEDLLRTQPYNNGMVDVDLLMGTLLVDRNNKKDLVQAMPRLKWATMFATNINRTKAFYQLARAELMQGNDSGGEAYLDSMYVLLHKSVAPIYIKGAYSFALNHYLRNGNVEKIKLYSKAMLDEYHNESENNAFQKLSEMVVKYVGEMRDKELEMERIKARNKEFYGTAGLVICVVVIFLLVILYLKNRRLAAIRIQVQNEMLDKLFDDLENERNLRTNAESRLSGLLSEGSWKGLFNISPSILKKEGDGSFRRRFSAVYPNFLSHLKERVPNLTYREEFLCMLIVMGLSNEEIERVICVAHQSLLQSRYRLRHKMNIGKDASLEKELMKLR